MDMVIADSDYEGSAIETLGSLFKITQVFLWDDGLQLPLSTPQQSKLAEADDGNGSDPVPDWSGLILLPEDLELNREMNELGLPLSFQTHKQKCGTVKGKRKGARSKQQRSSHNPVAETLYEASVEEVASPAEFHDKTNSSISCISVLGQSETSYCDIAVEVDMTRCASGEGESETLPMSSEGSGCDRIDGSNYCSELGEWMVLWDTFYERKYFYNVKTHSSTWDPPPGTEHLAIGGCTESDNTEALESAEDHGTQHKNQPPEETWIEENSSGQPHEGYSAHIGVSAGNLVSETTTNNEDQSIDHSDENLERSSCNDAVSYCSFSHALDHIISSNERCIQEESEVDHTPMENMVIGISGLDTEPDPSMLKKEKKKKRRQKQRKIYNETEDFQFQETPEAYSATIGKYWCQRYILFSRFDDGVKMDEEGWFSVTPEAIARYQSIRCASGTIIDCFTGVGGNAIQFTQRCGHVTAIDIDPLKIDYARHNAAIYGVDDQIDFIIGDFFLLAPKLKADTVFLSPPWGGPDYSKVMTYDMKTMLKPHDGYTLFHVAKEIASRVVMFLPKNINFNQLAELSLSASPPWSLEVEKVHLNGKLKAITAYFSDTAVGGC